LIPRIAPPLSGPLAVGVALKGCLACFSPQMRRFTAFSPALP
jgi:hypothetical protein